MHFTTEPSFSDRLISGTGLTPSIEKATSNNMYGHDPLQRQKFSKNNKETSGYVFVVRPQLNLSDVSIYKNPELYELSTEDRYSVWNYLRGLLDPLWASKNPGLVSHFLNNKNAFIPFISNGAQTVTGFESEVLPTRETNPGLAGEQMFFPDGIKDIYGITSIDIEVRNFASNVIDKMTNVWLDYCGLNHLGKVRPYPHLFANNRVDWPTRIYRLVMSEDMRFVTQIACTGYSLPVNTESGKIFDFNKDTTYSDVVGTRTLRFKSSGIIYNKIKYMDNFNWTVGVFNPAMMDLDLKISRGEELGVVRVPRSMLNLMAHKVYPHINLHTFELEWYVDKENLDIKDIK